VSERSFGVLVRLAASSDAANLARLAAEFRDYLAMPAPSDEELRVALPLQLRDEHTEFLLAEDDTQAAVGFVQLRFRSTIWYGHEVEIEDFFVAAAARGCGVGRQLMQASLERARNRQCHRVSLTTNERNGAAVALYESFGLDARRVRWQGGRQIFLERNL